MITDRDIAIRGVARHGDLDAMPISEVMSSPVAVTHESTAIEDALSQMARISARRIAVTGEDGRFVGLLALDDVLELLIEEAETIGRILKSQAKKAGHGDIGG